MSKCIHVLDIGDDYIKELKTNYTLPSIKSYANKIGADLNIIKKRKFEEWPLLYEHMQVYEDGKDYEWNILVDLDILFSKYYWDVTEALPKNTVGITLTYPAHTKFKRDNYFLRDDRNIGICCAYVVASHLNHDLWKPFEISREKVIKNMYSDPRVVNEYCISRNHAKYGLKSNKIITEFTTHFDNNSKKTKQFFHHLNCTDSTLSEQKAIEEAKMFIQTDLNTPF